MPNITLDGEYQTRDGRPVRVLCVDAKIQYQPVIVLTDEPGGRQLVGYRCSDGRVLENHRNNGDLIPVPKKHKWTYWLVHYKCGWSCIYQGDPTLRATANDIIAITGPHEIEFTEGEGLKGADDAHTED